MFNPLLILVEKNCPKNAPEAQIYYIKRALKRAAKLATLGVALPLPSFRSRTIAHERER